MEEKHFELIISPKKYWGLVVLFLFLLFIMVRLYPYLLHFSQYPDGFKKNFVIPLFFFVVFYFFLQELTWLTAKVKVTMEFDELIITKYFWGRTFVKKYDISKIKNLTIKHKVPGDYSLGSLQSPSSMNLYITKEPTVLHFDYDGTTESIGTHLKDFHAESIIKEIDSRKKKLMG